VFYMDIPKVDKDVAYVACVSEAYCKRFFKMFRLFQTYVASVFDLDVAHVSHICCVGVAGTSGGCSRGARVRDGVRQTGTGYACVAGRGRQGMDMHVQQGYDAVAGTGGWARAAACTGHPDALICFGRSGASNSLFLFRIKCSRYYILNIFFKIFGGIAIPHAPTLHPPLPRARETHMPQRLATT